MCRMGAPRKKRGKPLEPLAVRAARVVRRLEDEQIGEGDERYLIARSLAATPDERWSLHETFLRSHGLYSRSGRRAYGFR